ncbi:hypothetical protein CsatB_008128 [Cannabis sativa]|uniref:uncharacterized protein LOC115725257 n=1 Tax=Cannabis sativa TaxID=3483 RepID=UPI0011DFB419|nr:uncharacterized protein LOC115725257 [Cannabis sativa]
MEEQYAAFSIHDDDEEGLIFEAGADGLAEIDDRWLLVGRFLTNRAIDFQAMQNKIATLWQPGRGLYMKELDSNLFLFQFYHEVDIERVIEGSPWTFDRASLIFERVKSGENPRSIPLVKLDLWVQLYNLTVGFMSDKVIQGVGNYIGSFIKSDPNNFSGVWRDYLRIRVSIRVDKPLKKKKKFEIRGGPTCHVHFKYEDLPTFCFICGVLGHSERFCEKLFEVPREQIVQEYNLDLKAAPRRRNYADGSRWLKSGLAIKSNTEKPPEATSSNGGGRSHQIPPFRDNQRGRITMNQVSSLIHQDLRSRNESPSIKIVDQSNEAQITMEKSLILRKDNPTGMMAPTQPDLNLGLVFIDNKRRRMGHTNEVGLNEIQEIEMGRGGTNNDQDGNNMDISQPETNVDTVQNDTSKNLLEAGAGSQARQEL